jgi:hypothetical protein
VPQDDARERFDFHIPECVPLHQREIANLRLGESDVGEDLAG